MAPIKLIFELTALQLSKIASLIGQDKLTQIATIIDGSAPIVPLEEPTPVVVRKGFQRPEPEIKIPDTPEIIVMNLPEGTGTRKRGGKTGPKMPGLGRSPETIAAYAKAEEERTIELDEEELLKEQRREERAARKADKEKELEEKKADEQKANDEVAAIKATEEDNNTKIPTTLAPKPWMLNKGKNDE